MSIDCLRIDTDPLDGPTHMAVDEFLWKSAERDTAYLRIYQWDGAWLSLGYFQNASELSTGIWKSLNWVRRQTGGGAIVHDHDLTYSLALPCASLSIEPRELYRIMHRSFVKELRRIGIEADLGFEGSRTQSDSFLCFERRDRDAVRVASSKILGSAQRTSQRSVLMHGSVLLRQSQWTPELSGLSEFADEAVDCSKIRTALLKSAEVVVGSEFTHGELTQEDWGEVEQITRVKYANPQWALKR